MFEEIKESDWKILRELRPIALDRYCLRVLSEVERLSSQPEKTSYERYLAIYDCIKQRDKELGRIFLNPSRSKALLQLMLLWSDGLLTPEELARFSPETVEKIRFLCSGRPV
jgi:hypothetical protein